MHVYARESFCVKLMFPFPLPLSLRNMRRCTARFLSLSVRSRHLFSCHLIMRANATMSSTTGFDVLRNTRAHIVSTCGAGGRSTWHGSHPVQHLCLICKSGWIRRYIGRRYNGVLLVDFRLMHNVSMSFANLSDTPVLLQTHLHESGPRIRGWNLTRLILLFRVDVALWSATELGGLWGESIQTMVCVVLW
jgi:hypothetical protein